MTALLEANEVGKVFSARKGLWGRQSNKALVGASLRIDAEKPTLIAIAGESGSGKTTLARLLLGVAAPSSGILRYRGKDMQRLSAEERKMFRREVQAVFQDPFEVYNPFYKVDHVLETPIRKFGLAKTRAEARTLMEGVLRRVGLRPEETLGRYPHQLSGGQRQRIMISRALLLQPRIIIADEPVSMVDASLRATILENLLQLHRELGISLIYITHDLTTAYQLCNKILILYRGSVVESGEVGPIIQTPQHPYTRLLVDSIPNPDPDRAWGSEVQLAVKSDDMTVREAIALQQGCLFAERCPSRMAVCTTRTPLLHSTQAGREVACFLYEESDKA